MSSIIEGYNYDIFISYRQKDNKGDRWISKFVETLKTELEATFKEDVSTYFDENPHDRLQETYDVDKSLESKLKCLIFIPVLSQTYCDPNSYAWQHEFLAFLKALKNDRFGKDVKLRSGNVSSRILPIRIHDLEHEDVNLYEKETGSVLRAVDFIFKTSSGISRPLLSNEDHPNDNLNKTYYRDQISKVAYTIKEIVLGMSTEPVLVVEEKTQTKVSFDEVSRDERSADRENPVKAFKRKIISTFAVLAILIITGILIYPKVFKRDKLDKLKSSDGRISIAVMPFLNMTNDTIWNVWQDGIQFNLITSLSNYSDELKVSQTESINNLIQSKGLTNYASVTPSVASTISQKLDASIFIYGNISQAGKTIRINAQIIDSETEESFKSFQMTGSSENILHIVDSLSVMIKNFLVISQLGKELPSYFMSNALNTSSPEAFRYFIYGRKEFTKRDFQTARNWLHKAINVDSGFIHAIIQLSLAYGNDDLYDDAKKWCLRVYEKRDQMPVQQKIRSDWIHARYFETPLEQIKYLKQLLDFDPQNPITYFNLGNCYIELFQYEKAIPEYEKTIEIYKKWELKPFWIHNYTYLGLSYYKTGMFKKVKELYRKAEQDFPDDPDLKWHQALISLTEGDTISANQYIKKFRSICKEYPVSESMIIAWLANLYSEAGTLDKAEEYYRKALSIDPEKAWTLSTLAYFLIDKERNIIEGMELIEEVLALNPDNYDYLDTKGWGFYKQGKYKEAIEILQKSWDLRREKAIYDHQAFLHLEESKKAVASQKNN